MSDEQVKKLGMRLPDDLHAELVRAAKEDRRSLHGEIIHLLYEQLKRRPAPSRQAA